jgi:hypothetical protein
VSVASEIVAIQVDDDAVQVITMPAVASGSNLKRDSLASVLNSKLTGVTVKLEDNKLVFTSKTKGSSSRLRFWSKAALIAAAIAGVDSNSDLAHVEFGVDAGEDTDTYGQAAYTGKVYTVPFDQFPTYSYHPDASELVFDTDDVTFFRSFNQKLSAMSPTSAINWTSYLTGPTKIDNNTVTFQSPSTTVRARLYAKDSTGQSTNKVFDPGVDASALIPCTSNLSFGNPSDNIPVQSPDASGDYAIYLEAKGVQDYLTDQTLSIGTYAGAAGNDINLKFDSTGTTAAGSLTWNVGASEFTLQYKNDASTWADVKALFDAHADVPTVFQTANILYPEADAANLFDTHDKLHDKVFYLHGGRDPVDFGSNYIAGTDEDATIVGGVHLTDAVVATVEGKELRLSANGKPWQTVTIPSTLAALVTAIVGLDDINCTTPNIYSEHDESPGTGTSIKIEETDDAVSGHESTLELAGDPGVIETLFEGFLTKTEALANGSGLGPVVGTLTAATDYNLSAVTELEKAVVPGSTSLVLGSVTLAAHFVFEAAGAPADATYNLVMSHSNFTPNGLNLGDAFTASVTVTAGDEAHDVAAAIVTGLTNVTGNASTVLSAVSVLLGPNTGVGETTDPARYICIYDNEASSANNTIKVHTSTDAVLRTAIGTDAINVDLTTAQGSITIVDSPTTPTLPMVATPSVTFPAPTGFSLLDDDHITTTTASTTVDNLVDYGIGVIDYQFHPELVYSTSWSQSLSYSRGAANFTSRNIQGFDGIVWTGRSAKVVSGDRLFEAGLGVASIVKTENHTPTGAPGTWGTGSTLVMSTEGVEKGKYLSQWYITAENLAQSGGRTTPEVTWDTANGIATLRGSLNRGPNGIPVSGSAKVYVQFKALRLDVTEKAAQPGLLVFNDSEEVSDQIGPIVPDNPLAWACYTAFLNAPTIQVSALGISAVSSDAPYGTVTAYESAFSLLKRFEIYSLVPLTQDMGVIQLANLHVTVLSEPAQRKERIALTCPDQPTEEPSTLVGSASDVTTTEISSNVYQFDFGDEVNWVGLLDGKLDANGDAISAGVGVTFTAAQGVYLTRSGDAFNYLVTKLVTASVIECDLATAFDEDQGPGTFGNDDAYYRTVEDNLILFDVAGENCSLWVRQAAIDTSTSAGKLKVMTTLAEIAGGVTGFQSRRLVMVQPENVSMDVDGSETLLPGFYLCAGIAGMIAVYEPSQPFTNLPMVGFVRPFGSSDVFSETEMATAAAGGIYWIIQDATGAPLASRHQLTTDLTSLKTRELSVTKAVDFVAKTLRIATRKYIGRNNITPGLLQQLSFVLQGSLRRMVGFAVQSADLGGIEVNPDALDEILLDVTLVPYYPANRIRIRIIV